MTLFRVKEGLGINALHACVYSIYIRQLSSFRAPTLWFIGLTVATYHTQYTFPEFTPNFLTRKRTKHENTRTPPFSYDTYHMKMAADVNTGAQSIEPLQSPDGRQILQK